MAHSFADAFRENFLGNSPSWYKLTIIGFLVVNPFIVMIDPFLAGWVLVIQFIFTLAMALKCYPLQPGGLLAVEAIILGLATPEMVFHEAEVNFPVIMLLMFMVAGIYFLREFLLFTFTKILLGVKSKMLLSLMFSFTAAFLSAFLDALTVTAVIITVAVGFYGVYHKVASGKQFDHAHDATTDDEVIELHPGQRNSLDALCKRYEVDASNRDLHGALIDADRLARVYVAMTGGQTALFLDESEANGDEKEGGIAIRASRPDLNLVVVRASTSENAAHEAMLEKLRGAGEYVWDRLNGPRQAAK